jgi:hypothetical protein
MRQLFTPPFAISVSRNQVQLAERVFKSYFAVLFIRPFGRPREDGAA